MKNQFSNSSFLAAAQNNVSTLIVKPNSKSLNIVLDTCVTQIKKIDEPKIINRNKKQKISAQNSEGEFITKLRALTRRHYLDHTKLNEEMPRFELNFSIGECDRAAAIELLHSWLGDNTTKLLKNFSVELMVQFTNRLRHLLNCYCYIDSRVSIFTSAETLGNLLAKSKITSICKHPQIKNEIEKRFETALTKKDMVENCSLFELYKSCEYLHLLATEMGMPMFPYLILDHDVDVERIIFSLCTVSPYGDELHVAPVLNSIHKFNWKLINKIINTAEFYDFFAISRELDVTKFMNSFSEKTMNKHIIPLIKENITKWALDKFTAGQHETIEKACDNFHYLVNDHSLFEFSDAAVNQMWKYLYEKLKADEEMDYVKIMSPIVKNFKSIDTTLRFLKEKLCGFAHKNLFTLDHCKNYGNVVSLMEFLLDAQKDRYEALSQTDHYYLTIENLKQFSKVTIEESDGIIYELRELYYSPSQRHNESINDSYNTHFGVKKNWKVNKPLRVRKNLKAFISKLNVREPKRKYLFNNRYQLVEMNVNMDNGETIFLKCTPFIVSILLAFENQTVIDYKSLMRLTKLSQRVFRDHIKKLVHHGFINIEGSSLTFRQNNKGIAKNLTIT